MSENKMDKIRAYQVGWADGQPDVEPGKLYLVSEHGRGSEIFQAEDIPVDAVEIIDAASGLRYWRSSFTEMDGGKIYR